MVVCLWLPCVAMAVPDAFFININDATETMLGSLDAFGYIPATNPRILGGEFGIQPGAVCSVTNETANGLGAVDIHAEYFEGNPFSTSTTAIVNFNIATAVRVRVIAEGAEAHAVYLPKAVDPNAIMMSTYRINQNPRPRRVCPEYSELPLPSLSPPDSLRPASVTRRV
jgi:hypothetical protein